MAHYKVPQDVEADDKLIGPFSFRQFVYLLIAGGLGALAVALFQLFPLLAAIPVPFILLLLALALPLKKDQPMETYLAAIVSYYLKPHNRFWMPGQRESTILITAPKIVEEKRSRDLSQEEATHRLSFLADIIDTEGYAIKGASKNPMREDLLAEANATTDMFDAYNSPNISRVINEDRTERHNEAVREMREAITRSEAPLASMTPTIVGASGVINRPAEVNSQSVIQPTQTVANVANSESNADNKVEQSQQIPAKEEKSEPEQPAVSLSGITSDTIVRPDLVTEEEQKPKPKPEEKPAPVKKPLPNMVELANNADFSVATIAKQANRIKRKEDGEVFISLH